jgi:hypothetical protein
VNAILTLREMNPFAAFTRAIEMAELVPQQTLPPDVSTQVTPTSAWPPVVPPPAAPTLGPTEVAPAGPPARVRCDESDRSVYLDGKRVASEVELAVFRFFRAIAESYPDPISYKKIADRVPGFHGKHPTRDLKDRLPSPLASWVKSGKHGYHLRLPGT